MLQVFFFFFKEGNGCERWTIKKAERPRIDAFKWWCQRRFLRVPWTARRPNQSILKEINPGYSLEGLMLKLQHFGHLMQTADSLEKTLMLGKTEGKRRNRHEMVRQHYQLNGHESEQTPEDSDGQGGLACCSPWGCKESDTNLATEQQWKFKHTHTHTHTHTHIFKEETPMKQSLGPSCF